MEANAAVAAARAAVDDAGRALEMAVRTAARADADVHTAAEAEQQVAADLADAIRAAVKTGGALQAPAPSANAISRAAADAAAQVAGAAVSLLTAERDAALKALEAAKDQQQLATQAVLAEAAIRYVHDCEIAFDVLQRGHAALHALDSASYTVTGAGSSHLALPPEALKFIRWEVYPRQRPGGAAAAEAERWRAWRATLIADPAAPPPDDQ